MTDKEYIWTQESYSQWLKDSLALIINAEHESDSDTARTTMEVILKETSKAIKQNLKIPHELITYLIGRFDCYFAELEEVSKHTKKEATCIPEKLAEALHLKDKRPFDHPNTSFRLSLLSKVFCEAFHEAQTSEEKSNLRPADRLGRITPLYDGI
jgi:hypothetical protein